MTTLEITVLIVLIGFFFVTLGLAPLTRRDRSRALVDPSSKSRFAVRVVSVTTALFSSLLLAFLYSRLRMELPAGHDVHQGLGFMLLAIVPVMCGWASFQGWRMRRTGVVSLSSAWLLFGWLGFSVCLLHLVRGFWSSVDLAGLVIWSCVYVVGLVIGRQEKCFTL
jgi:hypothetical protein